MTLPPTAVDRAKLTAHWRTKPPFRHLILDGVFSDETLDALCGAVSRQPHWPLVDEIATVMASAPKLQDPQLVAVQQQLQAGPIAELLREVTGIETGELLLRSYVYLPGHDLLPHSDFRPGLGRVLAVILYLRADPNGGGALQLFDRQTGRICEQIAPKAGRLAVFEVSPDAIHAVAAVTAGARISLAGWYYARGVDPLAAVAPPAVPNASVVTNASPCPAALLQRVTANVRRQISSPEALRVIDEPTLGSFETAEVTLSVDAYAALERLRPGAVVLGATFVRQRVRDAGSACSGAILSKAMASLRPTGATVTVAICLSFAAAAAEEHAVHTQSAVDTEQELGAELVWHGSHGVIAVQPAHQGVWSVVEHGDDVGIYARRGAIRLPEGDQTMSNETPVDRLLIWLGSDLSPGC